MSRQIHGPAKLLVAVAAAAFVAVPCVIAAAQAQKVAWENQCTCVEGWLSNAIDPAVNARVDKHADSVVKITQDGSGTWGKAAVLVEGVNLDETPILEVKVDKVDLESAFHVAVASKDWSEMPVVIKRSSADGIHRGNLKKAIKESKNPAAWDDGFNVVIIVEGKGKASWVDYVRIQSER